MGLCGYILAIVVSLVLCCPIGFSAGAAAADNVKADIDFGPYMDALQRKVKSNWKPPIGEESRRVSVEFKVSANGTFSNIMLHESTGVATVDEAAIRAVKLTSPTGPLPEGSPSSVDITVTFDYNVAGQAGIPLVSSNYGRTTESRRTNNSDARLLNNDGVRALDQGNFQLAVTTLEKAVIADPSYAKARENLAIAYNNYGLSLVAHPKDAVKQFHRSLAIDGNNKTTKDNLGATINALGFSPRVFGDRVKLAKQAEEEKDYAGAIIEYEAALAIQEDNAVRKTLEALKSDHPIPSAASGKAQDVNKYMEDVLEKIQAKWHPAQYHEKVIVEFRVEKSGRVAMVKVTKQSNQSDGNAAKTAIESVSPVPPLPIGSPEYLDFELIFGIKKCWIYKVGERIKEPLNFAPYVGSLQRKIQAYWMPPKGYKSRPITVKLSVAPNGTISNIRLEQSSGIASEDAALIKAIELASPGPPLPAGVPTIDVEFSFN